ncbi:protein of unknown function [Eubacterium ruminantium]|uniref:DUF4250 domain-containing protein n=1 Tax=Eubacterium ruminantium TaxID=42322 RepID=A0A1T4K1D4_9FIRM|nr:MULTISPECIES: DUF4250 domain-containing protein [Eubacterium]MCR5368331.1 DUF4250 domain-containing protein [Eubacterium sp.]SCW28492.1 protein of unknown function [Eubacterium ruminantium]SDM11481.1 protein of unknown function [Eubacterium ruminantium]SJZ36272.1 protein of unknown function [Eubacterium ruminantium]
MNLPNDPIMLMSFVNTQLRDNYSSLDDLTLSLGVEKEEIENKLKAAGFIYDSQLNKFIQGNN